MQLFISGYGENSMPSIGLYNVSNIDGAKCIWNCKLPRSSYLSVKDNLLFGISELDNISAVHMLKRVPNGYTHVDSREINGGLLCHIAYLPINKIIVGACYESGHIFSIEVCEAGFGELITSMRQGVDDKQNVDNGFLTRAHCVVANKAETELYSANIALDRIYKYKISSGKLFENSYLSLPDGEGPRHIYINPLEDMLYIITEYSNKVFIVSLTGDTMKIINSVSILPDKFEGESFGSTICTSLNGKFLYAANRGANTIAIFEIKKDGNLIKVTDSSCFGIYPRHISLVGDGSYLAIANQESNSVSLCKIDSETGNIKEKMSIPFYKPSFVY